MRIFISLKEVVIISKAALKKSKDIIILTLRQYINNENNYKDFINFESDKAQDLLIEEFKKMNIYDSTPETLISFPYITISGGAGQMSSAGIGGDFATELYDPINGELIGYRHGGYYDGLNLNVEIGAIKNTEQEILNDLISTALRLHLRRKLESQGVLVKNIINNGEATVQYDSRLIYTSTLQISIFTEWYEDVMLLPVDQIIINPES